MARGLVAAALLVLAGLLLTGGAMAQGTIVFANTAGSRVTNGLTRQPLPVGGDFRVALFHGSISTPEEFLTQVAGPIGITTSDGRFNGGTVNVPGWGFGELAKFQVRSWDSRGGLVTSYAQALNMPTVLKGVSPVVTATNGSSLGSAGLQGFTLYSANCLSLVCPSNMTVSGSCSLNGVPVAFRPTATNHCAGGGLHISCSHTSGAVFTNASTTLVTCAAFDDSGHSVSCSFNITVTPATPVVTAVPLSRVVTNGGNATFNSSASGPGPLSYQWSHDGLTLAGATSSSYTVAAAGPADEGTYEVTVTGACGKPAKDSATLTVLSRVSSGVLLGAGTFWKYQFNGSEPAGNWRTNGFNDSAWPGGRAELGFGDGDEATVIGAFSNRFLTAYFRRPFLAPTDAAATNLLVALRRDDGAVVYLNGVELFRSNMPTGSVNYATLAPQFDPADGANFQTMPLPTVRLMPGTNMLAAEVHQYDTNSSDMTFDLRLLALATNRPQAHIIRAGTNVSVSWPDPGWRLQSAAALGSMGTNASWTILPPSNSPAVFPAASRRFFRLIWP